jgi:hypothetical protein
MKFIAAIPVHQKGFHSQQMCYARLPEENISTQKFKSLKREREWVCGKIELTATVAVAMVAYARGWEQVAEVESLVNLSKSMGLKSDETMMHGARELESFKP